MTPAYAPVTSPSGTNHSSPSAYSGDGFSKLYEIASAYRPDFKVVYANGHGGGPATCAGDSPRLIANACAAGVEPLPAPLVSSTGVVGLTLMLVAIGIPKRRRPVSPPGG